MPTLTVELQRPHPGQREVMRGLSRYNVLCMGRRWGKTVFGVHRLLPALEGYPVAWFSPTYKMLEEVWRAVRQAYRQTIKRKDEQQKRLELITNGVIDFWSLDNADAVRGRKYKHIVIDEAAMIKDLEDVWQMIIRPTLTDYKGSADFLSTPRGTTYFKELFDKGDADWRSFRQPTTANPYIDPVEVEAARLELPELVYRQEYLAEFVDAAGTSVKREWLQYSIPPEGIELVMGVDLAISTKSTADYSACAVLGRDERGNTYVIDAQRVRASFHDVLRFIEGMAAKWQPKQIAIEQVQYQAAVVQELLRKTALPVHGVRPDKDKITRFQPLEARYQQGLIYHAHGLPRDFEQELLTFPVGQHDDYVDALGYAWIALQKVGSSWTVGGGTSG